MHVKTRKKKKKQIQHATETSTEVQILQASHTLTIISKPAKDTRILLLPIAFKVNFPTLFSLHSEYTLKGQPTS